MACSPEFTPPTAPKADVSSADLAVPAWVVAALYQFKAVENPSEWRQHLLGVLEPLGLCGTLLIAPEGVNGTLAGTRQAVTQLRTELAKLGFDDLEYKESLSQHRPFRRLKVRLKREIVTLGVDVAPRQRVGRYVEAQDWNALMADPDVLLIDTRNTYEIKAGTFEGAVDPQLSSFGEFPAWAEQHLAAQKGRKIAMFCTGGIRCEKSTSLLLELGFEDVYHLRGGILSYLEHVPETESRWNGECFVFDERVTVGHGLKVGAGEMCLSCGWPLTPSEAQHAEFERGVSCQHCFTRTTEPQKASFRERQQWYERRADENGAVERQP
ncbi:rhodanese-related sulfurtransferase [Deinococcus psychrotolerans]|uniref:tRNA uridine(34) hydroxylase n=1 Tax=Deinococcus psychrotolerans TaxID=2489213 RepID=A0A3G8Y7L3_9DEIO|nr:rhodanese-related sulfurtransferase [Deinococcus psychrotolerans]AZI41369.1 rhodanese-related sulfurtransferase [Deinococcus psychrotolerans]